MTVKTHETSKAAILLDLAKELQVRSQGMTLDDIARFVQGSRRTAERYRDELWRLFPDLRPEVRNDGRKAWKLPQSRFLARLAPDAEELAQVRAAAQQYEQNGQAHEANLLQSIYRKIANAAAPADWTRLDPDIEALLEAEGLATHQGPRKQCDPAILMALREAILEQRRVILHYKRRDTGALSKPLVCPYGFLLGRRQYLVAYGMHPKVREVRIYVLSNIRKVDVQDKSFEVDPSFDLQDFASRSFGSWFDENPVDVAWRFSPEVAADAREFVFHPSQRLEDQADGSLVVRFTACGTREMCWHLFTWGSEVEVLEPECLQQEYAMMIDNLQGRSN